MNILLIRPYPPNKLSFLDILNAEPLELEYLYTGLKKKGWNVSIFDGIFEKRKITDVIKEFEADIVCTTGYITQENVMMEIAKEAKKINKDIITIAGGVHVQINYKRFFNSEFDFLYRSESVDMFVKLIDRLSNKKYEYIDINGLCYKNNDGFLVNEIKPININELDIPDRSFFDKNKKYYKYLDLEEVASIKTSFSCAYSCNFCYCTLLSGGKYQQRDLELVIKEIKTIKTKNIQILDDDFLFDRQRLIRFVELIKENKIDKTFVCYARANFIVDNKDLVIQLSDIGFKYFLVGLEATNDDTLKSFNKGVTADINKECVKIINSTKRAECIGLMIAPIDATPKYFDDLYNWCVENELLQVTVSMFTPIPGTVLYTEYEEKLITNDIEKWDFLNLVIEPTNMTRKEFYLNYYKLIHKLYIRAKKNQLYKFIDIKYYLKAIKGYLLNQKGKI